MSTRIAGPPGAARAACLILATLAGCALAGCQQRGLTATPTPNALTGQNPSDVKYYRSDEPVRLGIQRFNEGNFGLSQHYFQDAVFARSNGPRIIKRIHMLDRSSSRRTHNWSHTSSERRLPERRGPTEEANRVRRWVGPASLRIRSAFATVLITISLAVRVGP